MALNCFHFTPIIKLFTQSQWVEDVPYWLQGQKFKVKMHWFLKMVCFIISFPSHLPSWNFTQRLLISRGYVLLILRSEDKVEMHWLQKTVYGALLLSLWAYNHETSQTDSSLVENVPNWYQGSKVKITLLGLLKKCSVLGKKLGEFEVIAGVMCHVRITLVRAPQNAGAL